MTEPPAVPDYDQVWSEVYGDIQAHGPVHRHMERLVRGLLEGLDYQSVLDVGCGPGHNLELLVEGRGPIRVGGVDISPLAVERARQRFPAGRFSVGDVQADPIDGVWDLVHCSLVLEHLPDDEAALRNLRPAVGGNLLITTIAGDYERHRPWEERMGHVRNYRRGELESKLEAAGFDTRGALYWGFPFYSPIARRLQNLSSVGTGEFGRLARVAASVMNGLYHLNSSRRGDLLLVNATPRA